MQITTLVAENFKRLKAVRIDTDGSPVVVLSGRNAQGKSSVLDAIWAALAGKDGVKEVKRPIRDGETKARVEITLDDIVVTRRWSGAGSTLEVKSAQGAKFPSPQRMLDDLIGKLSFDPLAFAQSDPKAQLATLIDLADLDFDPDENARLRKEAYEDRTIVNRDVKRIQAQIDSLPNVTQLGQRVDVAALSAEIQTATQISERKAALLEEHARNKAEIERLTTRQAEIVAEGSALPKTRPLEVLVEEMSQADEINKICDVDDQRTRLLGDLASQQAVVADHNASIELCDKIKAEGIARAKFPVDGLGFDDEGVLYNGVPFQQASAAERLRVSVAMAMAMNPKIRVIRITDGSLLDSDNMRMIEEMAKDQDFQVWVEKVDESGEVGVVIEDGEVRNGS